MSLGVIIGVGLERCTVSKEFIKKLRQRFCRHSYADKNLNTTRYKDIIIFSNKCVKCGKVYSVWVSNRDIDSWVKSDMMRSIKGGDKNA